MKTYKIKKGNHYSFHAPKIIIGKHDKCSFKVRFHIDCWFSVKDPDDHAINKLFGWSYGFHHKDSIRIGWKPNADRKNWIELHFYIYAKGERISTAMSMIECGKSALINLDADTDLIEAVVKKEVITDTFRVFAKINRRYWGYFLYPYFGGKKTAPHDVHIDLDTDL